MRRDKCVTTSNLAEFNGDCPPSLPSGWCWTTIAGFGPSMKNGIYKEKQFYAETGTPCLRMYNIDGGQLVWRDVKYMTLTREEIEEYGLVPGDIVLTASTAGNLWARPVGCRLELDPASSRARETSGFECVLTSRMRPI